MLSSLRPPAAALLATSLLAAGSAHAAPPPAKATAAGTAPSSSSAQAALSAPAASTSAAATAATAPPLPLPDAPVLVVIPSPAAFGAALGGGLKGALEGTLAEGDPVLAAWRRTRVGAKLGGQWEAFGKDLPLTWKEISALRPSAVGLSLLSAGSLEAVLAIRTAAAALPLKLPAGSPREHRGIPYRLVAPGAGDGRKDDRRMGLAWANARGVLLVATSERALQLSLDRLVAGTGPAPLPDGLVSMRLDLDALRKDRYFRREFPWDGTAVPTAGILRCALRIEGKDLVEVREGSGPAISPAPRWPLAGRGTTASGWEPGAERLAAALRLGTVAPWPGSGPPRPPAAAPLPSAAIADQRYLVDLRQPGPAEGPAGEDPDAAAWRSLVAGLAPPGWGWETGERGAVRVVFKAPPSFEPLLAARIEATLERTAGGARRVASPGGSAWSVGPGLAVVSVLRRGEWLWVGNPLPPDLPEPAESPGLVRWARFERAALEAEAPAWKEAEGPFSPEKTRPFSDRILGLASWAPRVGALSVERRSGPNETFTERVVFEAMAGAPAASQKQPGKGKEASPAPRTSPPARRTAVPKKGSP